MKTHVYHLDRICCNCFSLHFGSLLFGLACLDHVHIGVVVVNYIHWIVFIFSDQKNSVFYLERESSGILLHFWSQERRRSITLNFCLKIKLM